jgi:hypothetical protein
LAIHAIEHAWKPAGHIIEDSGCRNRELNAAFRSSAHTGGFN